jgi:hypothetical protein
MLAQRVIALFPAIHALLAEEANNIVGIIRERQEEETGSCKLVWRAY